MKVSNINLIALLGLLTSVTGGAQAETPSAPAPGSGQALYQQYCAVCHGLDGRGAGPAAAALKQQPSDLTVLKQNNEGRFPRRKVRRVLDGRSMPAAHGLRDMPIWGRVWKQEDLASNEPEVSAVIIKLSSYLETLQQ